MSTPGTVEMRFISIALLSTAALFAGCSTTQHVTLGKTMITKPIRTVAQVPAEGNSAEMNLNLEGALTKEGVSVKQSLPQGTNRSKDVDALVTYVDVWRWDLLMYMQKLNVRLHDAETGDLLAMAQWSDSPLHGFRNAKVVMEEVVAEMLKKVRAATATTSASK
jgi:hypothetical protein